MKTGVSLITAGYGRLPQDTVGSPDIGVFNGIYHIITWNRHYIINNSKCLYFTLVGLMNSAEVQHMKHNMILILIMLTILPTTAECERGFSSVINIKTTARTSMKQEALSSLVRIKVDGSSYGIQSHRKHFKLVKQW